MRRMPQEIVMAVANVLKTARKGDFKTLSEIQRESGVHYVTVQSYMNLINFIQTRMPKIVLQENEKGQGIEVIEPSPLEMAPKDEIILFMFDERAFRKQTAVEIPKWSSPETVEEATKDGTVDMDGTKAYLTSDGIVKAALLADKREDALIRPIGEQFTWAMEDEQELSAPSVTGQPTFPIRVFKKRQNIGLCEVFGTERKSDACIPVKRIEAI